MDGDLLRPERPCYRFQNLRIEWRNLYCVAVNSVEPRVLLFT